VPADESRICLAFENVSSSEEVHHELFKLIKEYTMPEGDLMYSQETETVYVFFKNRLDAMHVMNKLQGQ
jgi:hypothetical protein